MTADGGSPRQRVEETWVTVAVTALPPGWRNFVVVEGRTDVSLCPAVLLQEHRATWYYDDVREHVVTHSAPFNTRAAFATYTDGRLEPADELTGYVGSDYGQDEV